jgi:hypothetical protein
VGQRLLVRRELRGAPRSPFSGHLEVEAPRGGSLWIPIDWTDRALPEVPYVRPRSAVHAAAPQLLAMAKQMEGWAANPQPASVARGMLGHAVPERGAPAADPVARPRPRASAAACVSAGKGAAPKRGRKPRHGGKP